MNRHKIITLIFVLAFVVFIYIFVAPPNNKVTKKVSYNKTNSLAIKIADQKTNVLRSKNIKNDYESHRIVNKNDEIKIVGRSMKYCFKAADLTDRPEPSTKENPTSRWQWKIEHPWVISLGDEELSQLRSSVYLANWNSSARQAKSADLAEGKNLELWDNQEKLKAKTELLDVGQSIQSVLEILGEPTKVYRYDFEPNYSEMVLTGKINETILSSNQIVALDEPITINYEPPGYSDRGVNYYFRKLVIDFSADGRIFQWHFDPLPLSSDW